MTFLEALRVAGQFVAGLLFMAVACGAASATMKIGDTHDGRAANVVVAGGCLSSVVLLVVGLALILQSIG